VAATRLGELTALFARLGVTAFGGPAAHVALMHREVVERRRWEDEQTFIDLVGLTALLPGPNSTELAIELGRRRAGTPGLVAAGVAFIVPAAVIVGFLAWAYTEYGDTPEAVDLRYGILPVVVGIIAHATWKLGSTAARTPLLLAVATGGLALFLAGVHELVVLALGALVVGAWGNRQRLPPVTPALLPLLPLRLGGTGSATSGGDELGLVQLFWSFLRIGALLFGSGYVIVAFLDAELVERLGVLTPTELLDAVTIGQVTPGPVFTTATFIGYLLAGPAGAVVATVAIFLPAFLLILALGRYVEPLLRQPTVRPVLDGLNAAAVGLIAGAAIRLADAGISDPLTAGLALGALLLLLRTAISPTWLIAGGALVALGRIVLG
jgi:chromate transporter